MITIAERVSNGSAWLDEHYPDWWKSIDLGTLKVSSCHLCVLGQVYTGHIPADERLEILGQVLNRMAAVSPFESRTYDESLNRGTSGGFNVLYDYHGMNNMAPRLGFSIDWEWIGSWRSVNDQYEALTDEWTKVIISRRMAECRTELVAA